MRGDLGNEEGRGEGLIENEIIGEEMNTELETTKEASTLQCHILLTIKK